VQTHVLCGNLAAVTEPVPGYGIVEYGPGMVYPGSPAGRQFHLCVIAAMQIVGQAQLLTSTNRAPILLGYLQKSAA
jgi:hypothetical protein